MVYRIMVPQVLVISGRLIYQRVVVYRKERKEKFAGTFMLRAEYKDRSPALLFDRLHRLLSSMK